MKKNTPRPDLTLLSTNPSLPEAPPASETLNIGALWLSQNPESLPFLECLKPLLDPENRSPRRLERLTRVLMNSKDAEDAPLPADASEWPRSSGPSGVLETLWNLRIREGEWGMGAFLEAGGFSEAESQRLRAVAELNRRYGSWWIRSLLPSAPSLSLETPRGGGKPRTVSLRVESWLKPSAECGSSRGWTEAQLQAVLRRIPEASRRSSREWLGIVSVYERGLGDFHPLMIGGTNRVSIEPRELFSQILAFRPEAFFLFHNHPGGSLVSSEEDRMLTRNVQRLAAKLDCPLLGHGLVSPLGSLWLAVIPPTVES
jgi:hypothetical protein